MEGHNHGHKTEKPQPKSQALADLDGNKKTYTPCTTSLSGNTMSAGLEGHTTTHSYWRFVAQSQGV